ncbi:MAG: S-layer homology domain-containing protein [Clostridia bacterium]|nr:S-layer homology domain-containing protein [Clostridia bacterium]
MLNIFRILRIILLSSLLILVLTANISAESQPEFHFSMSVDGKNEKSVAAGDVITVFFTLERTDSAEPYTMYAFQNEISYDASFFELVEGSLFLKDGITARDLDARDHHRELYMNYISFSGGAQWAAKTIIGSFQLRVIAENGVSVIRCLDYGVSQNDGKDRYTATADNITVTVSNNCSVVFDSRSGSAVPSQTVALNTPIVKPTDPTRQGYTFTGWYTDVDCTTLWLFDQGVSANLHLYAGWKERTDSGTVVTLPFADVPPESWFYDSVCYVYRIGLMNGVSDTLFSPDSGASRAMIVTILWRLEKSPVAVSAVKFADVADGMWYSKAIDWASANGIVDGYGDGKFGPNDPITREQMAVILWRYAKFKKKDVGVSTNLAVYTDADQIGSYAIVPMQWACGVGLICGVEENVLSPKTGATRAQMATILQRLLLELQN